MNRAVFIRIVATVAAFYSVDVERLIGPRNRNYRPKSLTMPRKVAMALCRELTGASYPEIGRFFHRDHTVVLNACREMKNGGYYDLEKIRAQLQAPAPTGCPRCQGLLLELAELRAEIIELRARFGSSCS